MTVTVDLSGPWSESVDGIVELLSREDKSVSGFCVSAILCASMYLERAHNPSRERFLEAVARTYEAVAVINTVGGKS